MLWGGTVGQPVDSVGLKMGVETYTRQLRMRLTSPTFQHHLCAHYAALTSTSPSGLFKQDRHTKSRSCRVNITCYHSPQQLQDITILHRSRSSTLFAQYRIQKNMRVVNSGIKLKRHLLSSPLRFPPSFSSSSTRCLQPSIRASKSSPVSQARLLIPD